MALVTKRAAALTSAIAAALVAMILIGSQVLATAGPTTSRLEQPMPAASSNSPDAGDDEGDDEGECKNDACGNAHSKAVHAWVTCKAAQGKDACVKPPSPGEGLGHAKHSGTGPGPASADGHGHGWGRAHAPGQLKDKDKGADDEGAENPTD
jgi:hypothetical protein